MAKAVDTGSGSRLPCTEAKTVPTETYNFPATVHQESPDIRNDAIQTASTDFFGHFLPEQWTMLLSANTAD